MPLNCVVIRNGKRRKDILWNGGEGNLIERNMVSEGVLNTFLTVAMKEGDPTLAFSGDRTFGDLEEGKFVDLASTGVYYIETKCPLWHGGSMVLREDHNFSQVHPSLPDYKAGDELKMWRD